MRTTSAAAVQSVLDGATRRGIDVRPWLESVGLDTQLLSNPENRVALPLADRLIRMLVKATGDRDIALDTLLEAPQGQLAIFHYVTVNSHDLEEYLELNQSFSRLWGDGVEIDWSRDGDTVRVHFDLPEAESRGADVLRVVTQAWVGAVVLRARLATQDAFRPSRVSLQHGRPRDLTRMLRVFGVEPEFDAPRAGFEFAADQLQLPFPIEDPNLPTVLRARAQELVRELPGTDELAAFVRDRVRAALPGGPVTLEDVAAGLGMGPRTLQRRLSAEGASFRQVLDGCQRELAIEYMDEPELSVSEIASRLGFETQSAFTKKFKRWTGVTPREHRRQREA